MLVSSLTHFCLFFVLCQVFGTAEMNNLTMFYRAVQQFFREEQRMRNLLKLDVLVLQITLVGTSHIVSSLLKYFWCFFESPLISPQIPSLCSKTDSYLFTVSNLLKHFGLTV